MVQTQTINSHFSKTKTRTKTIKVVVVNTINISNNKATQDINKVAIRISNNIWEDMNNKFQ